ncbi:MAG: aminotransferase class I/II-fold pyridoxal phosphate-dependent enzyme, partial [Candidatus Omnitrophica bacterium]|nr:aminotransferase class I/II-fold pyridoxal phosphate-dependent enzyme [Candidatus Omnitrophota bacterium]
MSIPFIDFKEQNRLIQDEVDAGFKKVFEKGDYILGEQSRVFEDAFARYCEVQHGVGVNSGTDALHLALMALDIEEGDEVILPTHTFIATALCISFCRAKPVLVDIEPDTYNIDPKSFEKAITKKT